ncbi:unnamed protein product [Brugia timori]|uniref:Uncharacterized protein n=1 Tax=Brugia timori TaxID=42155 RepID=A0A0R3RB31_9BILA|nr:unnamed protein product [Brugia timori]
MQTKYPKSRRDLEKKQWRRVTCIITVFKSRSLLKDIQHSHCLRKVERRKTIN